MPPPCISDTTTHFTAVSTLHLMRRCRHSHHHACSFRHPLPSRTVCRRYYSHRAPSFTPILFSALRLRHSTCVVICASPGTSLPLDTHRRLFASRRSIRRTCFRFTRRPRTRLSRCIYVCCVPRCGRVSFLSKFHFRPHDSYSLLRLHFDILPHARR